MASKTLPFDLPEVRGEYRVNADLSKICWFRVGGPAEVLFKPADDKDLSYFLHDKPADVPVTLLGVGSNLLVRDGGIKGVVIQLGKDFADIVCQETEVCAGAGAMSMHVARASQKAGISGLEFLAGIPGSIGGALAMNAGAYGKEVADVFVEAEFWDEQGNQHSLGKDAMGFTYRHAKIPSGWIIDSVVFRGERDDPDAIDKRISDITRKREETQPIRTRTGGSTFTNPPGNKKAWELIDEAGCRGLQIGGAKVSEKHCNFLMNVGEATAADIENLGKEIRRRVKEKSGIELCWEIRIIGDRL